MSNEEFFNELGHELLVLNGLDYSVNNHSPGQRYMATGKLDSMAYPTFAALVAAYKGHAYYAVYWMIVGVAHAIDYHRRFRETELIASQLATKLAS